MKALTTAEIWNDLKPRIDALIASRVRSSTPGVGGSTGGVSISAHALNGSSHTGTLGNDQAPQFLLRDGSRSLTGHLSVSTGIQIDGVDLSAHVANPDAHHAQAHVLATNVALGPDHSVSGLTGGHVLRATTATTARFSELQHSDLGGVTADQHHAKLHDILGSDHTVSGGAALDVIGQSGAGVLARLTPSAAPGAASAILRSDASGYLTLVRLTATDRLRSPLIDTVSGDLTMTPANSLVLNPASNLVKLSSGKALQSDNYASQTTGMRITHAGEGDFRYLFTDELHAKTFIADLEQALAGGQIIGKSVSMLSRDFTTPAAGGTATIYLRDLPSAENMAVFESGDMIRLRQFSRSGGALSASDCWGTVSSYTDLANKEQSWTFTRSSAPNAGAMSAGTVVATDSIVLDYGVSGNGFHEINAIDGAYALNSPYSQIVTWATHPATGQTVRVRTGNLRGLFSVANEYGFYAGSGVTDADAYLRLSSYTTRFNNLDTRWYSGGVPIVKINSVEGVTLNANTTTFEDKRAFSFTDNNDVVAGGLYGRFVSTAIRELKLNIRPTTRASGIYLITEADAGYDTTVQLSAKSGADQASIVLSNNSSSGSQVHVMAMTLLGDSAVFDNVEVTTNVEANTFNGYQIGTSGNDKILRTRSDGYLELDNWIRQEVGQGLFGNASPYAPHWFSHLDGWIGRSGNTTKSFVKLQTAGGVDRGFLYADSSNYVGLLDYSGAWRVKVSATTTDIFGTLTVDGSGEHKLAKTTNTYLYAQVISADRVKLGVWDSGGAVARKLCLNEAGGFVGVGCSDPAVELDVNGYSVRVRSSYTPASAGATGLKGQICYDGSYVYVCTATNTWKRAALSSW